MNPGATIATCNWPACGRQFSRSTPAQLYCVKHAPRQPKRPDTDERVNRVVRERIARGAREFRVKSLRRELPDLGSHLIARALARLVREGLLESGGPPPFLYRATGMGMQHGQQATTPHLEAASDHTSGPFGLNPSGAS